MGEELRKLWTTEDYWAVWLGLGIVLLALAVFLWGGTIKGWAITPGSWSTLGDLASDLAASGGGYLVVFLLFGSVFTLSMAIMGRGVARFVPGFVILFAGSLAVFYLAGWNVIKEIDLGAPFLALIIGLIVGNLVRLPDWFKTSLLTEYYIKTGIVLLGATLPLTLIVSAGPIAFLQATIVSVGTWLTIFFAATRLFKLEPQFGAVLGAGGAVCGVSASIAVGGGVTSAAGYAGYFSGGRGVYVGGDLEVVGGTKSFVEPHPTDPTREIAYVSLEGPEAGTYIRGAADLRAGEARVELPEHFALVTNAEGLTVQLTPVGEPLVLYIAEQSPERIVVREASGRDGRFNYLVQGVRKGHEDHQVIRDRMPRPEPPVPPSTRP